MTEVIGATSAVGLLEQTVIQSKQDTLHSCYADH